MNMPPQAHKEGVPLGKPSILHLNQHAGGGCQRTSFSSIPFKDECDVKFIQDGKIKDGRIG